MSQIQALPGATREATMGARHRFLVEAEKAGAVVEVMMMMMKEDLPDISLQL